MKNRAIHAVMGVMLMSVFNCQSSGQGRIREPAVDGQFYPGNAAVLRKDVDKYLSVKPTLATPPRMLISAHAGYVFSGPVAGRGFAEIDRKTDLVILVGPSHRKYFAGVSIPDVDAFRTPLGDVPLARDVIAEMRKNPVVNADFGAHSQEHCLEVQLPFLQVLLPAFRIVPMVTGEVDPAKVADVIAPFVKSGALVVASSDFSHYHPSEEARTIDKASVDAILAGNAAGPIDACGETAIRVLMRLAAKFGLTPVLLDARNSYETAPPEYKDPSRVVGYVSIAYIKPPAK